MDFTRLAQERFSVRQFSSKPVDPALITSVLETARLAPSAVNKQPTRYLVLKDPESLKKLKGCTEYIFDSPVAIVVLSDTSTAWIRPFDNNNSATIDASIAATHLMLAIHNAGLGTTWIGYFDPAVIRKTFNIPKKLLPIALFPVGYPAEDVKPSPLHSKRKDVSELVIYDSF